MLEGGKEDLNTDANNNSKIITIKRSAERGHIIKINVLCWVLCGGRSEQATNKRANAMRIIGANGENAYARFTHTHILTPLQSLSTHSTGHTKTVAYR